MNTDVHDMKIIFYSSPRLDFFLSRREMLKTGVKMLC